METNLEEILIDSARNFCKQAAYGHASEMRPMLIAALRKLNELDCYREDPEGFIRIYNFSNE